MGHLQLRCPGIFPLNCNDHMGHYGAVTDWRNIIIKLHSALAIIITPAGPVLVHRFAIVCTVSTHSITPVTPPPPPQIYPVKKRYFKGIWVKMVK